jgi:hypothetical protein
MNRRQEISVLRAKYAQAMKLGKRKTASLIYARLLSLMMRELRSENRKVTA